MGRIWRIAFKVYNIEIWWPNIYTYYGFSGQYGQVGEYTIKNDTLYFTQSYLRLSDKVYFSDRDSIYTQKFLIEKNSLIDVTDYTSISPLYNTKTVYKRIK